MTHGRDAQPDILFQGDGLKRGLCKAQGRVSCWTREVHLTIFAIRKWPKDKKEREYFLDAWKTRRACQERVKAYRLLIAQRDAHRSVFQRMGEAS